MRCNYYGNSHGYGCENSYGSGLSPYYGCGYGTRYGCGYGPAKIVDMALATTVTDQSATGDAIFLAARVSPPKHHYASEPHIYDS